MNNHAPFFARYAYSDRVANAPMLHEVILDQYRRSLDVTLITKFKIFDADQSNLSVGHSSQVRLDKFVYDPNKGTGSTVIEATRGTFRFSTGAQNKGEVKIKTPYGTLGTRG